MKLIPSIPPFYPDKWNKNNNNCSNKESTRANTLSSAVSLIQIGIKADIDLFVNKIHNIHHLNGGENRFVQQPLLLGPYFNEKLMITFMKLGYKSQLQIQTKQFQLLKVVLSWVLPSVKASKIDLKLQTLFRPAMLFMRNVLLIENEKFIF